MPKPTQKLLILDTDAYVENFIRSKIDRPVGGICVE